MGALVTGFLATPDVNGNLNTNLGGLVGNGLWLQQVEAIGLTLCLSIGATVVLGLGLKAVLGLRPSLDSEEEGLDLADHGEAGYHPEEGGAHGSGNIEGREEPMPVLATAAGKLNRAERM
jgi:Amt family ammonium transporter